MSCCDKSNGNIPEDGLLENTARQSFGQQIAGFAGTMKDFALSGFAVQDNTERMAVCQGCEHYAEPRCHICGCYAELKTRIRAASCPKKKW